MIYLQETICSSNLQLSACYSMQQEIRVQERNKLLLLGIFPICVWNNVLNHRLVDRTTLSNIIKKKHRVI
jgi:hypothetical protein